MRWRVTYDITTTTWHAFGRTVELNAADQKHAIAAAERYLYARKEHTLAERHDDAGEGFNVIITAAVPCAGRGGAMTDDILDTDADEITRLRADLMGQRDAYDILLDHANEVERENAAERIENIHLREAFVVMERAYNETEAKRLRDLDIQAKELAYRLNVQADLAALREQRCEWAEGGAGDPLPRSLFSYNINLPLDNGTKGP